MRETVQQVVKVSYTLTSLTHLFEEDCSAARPSGRPKSVAKTQGGPRLLKKTVQTVKSILHNSPADELRAALRPTTRPNRKQNSRHL